MRKGTYAYDIWIDAEFIGEGFYAIFVFIYASFEKLQAKMYKVGAQNKHILTITTDIEH